MIDELKKLGLSTNEARIYIAMLELGHVQAGEIAKKAQINRTTTYDSIERLLDKGLLTYVMAANRKVFSAVSPEKIIGRIREQEQAAKDIMPQLLARFKQVKHSDETSIYKGRKGIKAILQDVLKTKEYVAYGSRGMFLEIMRHDFINFQKRKQEKKIRSRVILAKSSKDTETVKLAFAKFRYIPDEYSSPTTTFVYGDRTAIIVWSETPIATVIKSKEVAESYLHYFNLMWTTAKEIQ